MDEDEARQWLAALPAELHAQRRIMEGLLDLGLRQQAVRTFLVGCSIGRGAADALSDVDSFVGGRPDAVDEVVAAVLAALPSLGSLVDVLEHPYRGPRGSRDSRGFAASCCYLARWLWPQRARTVRPPGTGPTVRARRSWFARGAGQERCDHRERRAGPLT